MLLDQNGVKGTIVDFSRLVLSGHSAGGHTVTQLLSDGCNSVQALVLLDPVDGLAPWVVFEKITEISSVIHPPKKVNFAIPLLHIGTHPLNILIQFYLDD